MTPREITAELARALGVTDLSDVASLRLDLTVDALPRVTVQRWTAFGHLESQVYEIGAPQVDRVQTAVQCLGLAPRATAGQVGCDLSAGDSTAVGRYSPQCGVDLTAFVARDLADGMFPVLLKHFDGLLR